MTSLIIDSVQDILQSGVYVITCNANGKVYYGSTGTLENRRKSHLRDLINGSHSNKEMQADFEIHGVSAFTISLILAEDERTKCRIAENDLIVNRKKEGLLYNKNGAYLRPSNRKVYKREPMVRFEKKPFKENAHNEYKGLYSRFPY